MASAQKLLLEGVSDAACFILGALTGYGLTLALGMDIFAEGYSGSSILGIAMVGLTGGAGLQLARLWRNRIAAREADASPSSD